MLLSLFLIRPSILILVLVTITIVLFHRMALEEEAYLMKVHGKPYETDKQNTGRYIPRLTPKDAA
jgi:protein-S-isoprenylcysteine O-methyltransferase Ste14